MYSHEKSWKKKESFSCEVSSQFSDGSNLIFDPSIFEHSIWKTHLQEESQL